MKTEMIEGEVVRTGGSNVFADLGLPNPEERLLKAQLMQAINSEIRRRALTQDQVSELVGLSSWSFRGLPTAADRDFQSTGFWPRCAIWDAMSKSSFRVRAGRPASCVSANSRNNSFHGWVAGRSGPFFVLQARSQRLNV